MSLIHPVLSTQRLLIYAPCKIKDLNNTDFYICCLGDPNPRPLVYQILLAIIIFLNSSVCRNARNAIFTVVCQLNMTPFDVRFQGVTILCPLAVLWVEEIAGMELTRMPTVGSTTDQSIGTAIAQEASGLTRSAGRKPRRMQEVATALKT